MFLREKQNLFFLKNVCFIDKFNQFGAKKNK